MRKRDIKIGMAVKHAKSGKPLGRVTRITDVLIYLDGESPIATPAELTPEDVECPDCDELVEEAIQWRDWQSLDMGVYCDKHDPFAQDVGSK